MSDHKKTLEIEQKIDVSMDDLERMFDLFKSRAINDITVKSHPRDYHDTQELDLRGRRVSMRIERNLDGSHVQTIKQSLPSTGNNKVVNEWEDAVKSTQPDFKAIADKEAKASLKDIKFSKLQHLYTTNVPAPKFQIDVKTPEGKKGRVELSFDVGEIYLSSQYQIKFNCFARIPVCEIEIEYISGDQEAIDFVAAEIMAECPSARVGTSGKGSRGARLYSDARNRYEAKKTMARAKAKLKK